MVDFQISQDQVAFQQTCPPVCTAKIQPIVEEIDQQEFSQCTPWERFKDVYKEAHRLASQPC